MPSKSLNLHPSALALLRRIEWRVHRSVESVLGGEYRSAFRGRGMEFDQVVKYTYGDDIRDIDWNVTARLGEPYRKKFVEERELSILLLLEDSPSLQFGSGERSKRDALLELAGLVTILGAINRDRIGLLHVTPSGHHFQPPLRGRGRILQAAAQLIDRPPPPLLADASAMRVPWHLVSRALPRHSVLVWLGDFAPRPPPDAWPLMRRRFVVMGFRVDDPWERKPPPLRATPVLDPVAGRLVPFQPGDRAQQAAHAAWAARREEAWQSLFPDSLSRLVVTPQDLLADCLISFFHKRMRTR